MRRLVVVATVAGLVATGAVAARARQDGPAQAKPVVVGVPSTADDPQPSGPVIAPPPLGEVASVVPAPAGGATPRATAAAEAEDAEPVVDPRRPPRPEPAPLRGGLAKPDGIAWPAPVEFRSATAVPDELTFVLVAGSDARPGQDPRRARADSVHLLAVDPKSGRGTVLGLPRDAWVDVPGRGRDKLANSLALGGPDLLAATVRRLTGLPVDYYVLVGFEGLTTMVDELGGVDVFVERRMADPFSGAFFEPGWHRMDGTQALAFARDRKDVAHGDFTRSEHQGTVLLSALAKMRSEVGDDGGVLRWARLLLRRVALDVPPTKLLSLGALARRLDPGHFANAVAPGRVGAAGGKSVVLMGPEAATLFLDLRDDAVVGGAPLAAPPPAATTEPVPSPLTAPPLATAPPLPSAPPLAKASPPAPSPMEPAAAPLSAAAPPPPAAALGTALGAPSTPTAGSAGGGEAEGR